MFESENKSHKNENAGDGLMRDLQTVKTESVYPEVNDKVKKLAMWLGIGFVVAVIFLQPFSGYS